MSRAMPNAESIPIVTGLIAGRAASARSLKTDGASVSLKGSTIIRVNERMEPDDTSTWKVEINLCGWGDTGTTRNCINSVLCRLNLNYRVGMHKHVSYLYLLSPDGDIGGPISTMKVLTALPENGWMQLPYGGTSNG